MVLLNMQGKLKMMISTITHVGEVGAMGPVRAVIKEYACTLLCWDGAEKNGRPSATYKTKVGISFSKKSLRLNMRTYLVCSADCRGWDHF